MPMRCRYIFVIALLFITSSQRPAAQTSDEEQTLHVPPKLVVASQWSEEKPELYMYEYSYRQELPLLPIIFFDYPGDYNIPSRYIQFPGSYQARDYTDTNDVGNNVGYRGKYYELLNILGYRMTKYPETRIMLQGGYSNEAGESEEIALIRAEVVREYLANVWKIDTGRVALIRPQLACDSGANTQRQEEARRVMIHTGSWNLIRPVSYAVTSMETSPLHLRFVLEPNARAENVKKIEFVMTCDDQVVGRAEVPAHQDSLLYRLEGYWWKGNADIRPERGAITVEALLYLHNNRYRRSNPVTIPVFLEGEGEEAEDPLAVPPEQFYLPFFSYKDSVLSGYHRLLIGEFLKRSNYPSQLAMQLTGSCEMSEDPEIDDPMLVAERKSFESMNSSYSYYDYAPRETGTLYIYTPRYEDEYYDEYSEYYSETEYYEEEVVEEEEENSGKYTIDSLAVARARTVVAFLRDTLGITIVNENEEFAKAQENMNWMQRYILTNGYYPFVYRPEDRWYTRSATVRVIPQHRIDSYRNWYKSSILGEAAANDDEMEINAEEEMEEEGGEGSE